MALVETFDHFGSYLRMLRKRARLTQRELGAATGYSESQINRFESGSVRPPEISTLVALFAPALWLNDAPHDIAQLLELAAAARKESLEGHSVSGPPLVHSDNVNQHRAAAQWAELTDGDILEAARQYLLAQDAKSATDLLQDRGARYAASGKGDDFVQVVDLVLSHLAAQRRSQANHDMQCRLLIARADALASSARAHEAEENLRTALTLANGAPHAILVYRLGALLTQRGRSPEALTLVRHELDEVPPKHVLIRANLKVVESGALMILSQFEEAKQASREAVSLANQISKTAPEISASILARGHNTLGSINAIQQNQRDALRHWQDAADAARHAKLKSIEYRCMGNIANVLFEQGDLSAATDACSHALNGLREIGDLTAAAKFVHLSAILHYVRGDLDQALTLANESLNMRNAQGDKNGRVNALNQRARILLARNELELALSDAQTALHEAYKLTDRRLQGYVLTALCAIHMARGDSASAQSAAADALALISTLQGDETLRVDITNWHAMARGSQYALDELVGASPATTVETRLERNFILATLFMRYGDHARATLSLNQARTTAENFGYRLYLRSLPQFASVV